MNACTVSEACVCGTSFSCFVCFLFFCGDRIAFEVCSTSVFSFPSLWQPGGQPAPITLLVPDQGGYATMPQPLLLHLFVPAQLAGFASLLGLPVRWIFFCAFRDTPHTQ
jgi:hypothetical protein